LIRKTIVLSSLPRDKMVSLSFVPMRGGGTDDLYENIY